MSVNKELRRTPLLALWKAAYNIPTTFEYGENIENELLRETRRRGHKRQTSEVPLKTLSIFINGCVKLHQKEVNNVLNECHQLNQALIKRRRHDVYSSEEGCLSDEDNEDLSETTESNQQELDSPVNGTEDICSPSEDCTENEVTPSTQEERRDSEFPTSLPFPRAQIILFDKNGNPQQIVFTRIRDN